MKTLAQKELIEKGCVIITLGGGAICIVSPVGVEWSVKAKTMVTARKLATKKLNNL